MTVILGDRIRLTMIGDMDGADEVVQSYQFRMVSGAPLSDDDAMGDVVEVFEALWVILKQLFAIAVVFRRLKGQDVVSGRLLPEQTFVPALPGVITGSLVPTQVNFPVTFNTTFPGVQLRKLWGPPANASITAEGVYGSSALIVAGNAAAFLLAPMLGTLATWEYGYESPKALGWVVPDAATFTEVPGTLRRRRQGQGS